MGNRHDLEDEHDGAEPPEDDEPSLGSFDGLMMDQEVAYLVSGRDGRRYRCGRGWRRVVRHC
jgi:hypothetical protein